MIDFAILASGPSLTAAQCDAVRAWRARAPRERRVIVINTTFRAAPWADILYACDPEWWAVYAVEVAALFVGDCWTQDAKAARAYGLRHIQSRQATGLCRERGVIHQGGYGAGNSGFQALNLAYHLGARRIVLVGYDMRAVRGARHWHVEHPGTLGKPGMPFSVWRLNMPSIARDLASEGVEVVNCTPGTALDCFPCAPLEQALAEPLEAAA